MTLARVYMVSVYDRSLGTFLSYSFQHHSVTLSPVIGRIKSVLTLTAYNFWNSVPWLKRFALKSRPPSSSTMTTRRNTLFAPSVKLPKATPCPRVPQVSPQRSFCPSCLAVHFGRLSHRSTVLSYFYCAVFPLSGNPRCSHGCWFAPQEGRY
jgi:hypothetical protein